MQPLTEKEDYFGAHPWDYKQPHTTNNNIEWYFNEYFTHYMKQNKLPNCKMWVVRDLNTNERTWVCTEHKKHGCGYIVFESSGNAEGVITRIDLERLNRELL